MKKTNFSMLGYSQKMYSRIHRKKVWFALSITVIILCLPLLYTVLSDEYVIIPKYVPYLIGSVIFIFFVILLLTLGKNHESTFEGEIIKKEIVKHTCKSGKVVYHSRIWVKDINGYHVYYDLYTNAIEKKAGSKEPFAYYRVGEYVRKIYGLKFPEKLVKHDNGHIICVKCGRFNNVTADNCRVCRFPLFK